MNLDCEPALKSVELTARITEAAVAWLEGIGCKPVETEVGVDNNWIADAAAIWIPTRTEAQKLYLIPRNVHGSDTGGKWSERNEARERAFATIWRPLVVVHEVKVTAADFRKDGKWQRPWPGDVMVLSVPAGLLDPVEYPEGWFVVEHATTGSVRRLAQRGRVGVVTLEQRCLVTTGIAMRHYNRHRYVLMRDLMKKARDGDTERRLNARLGQLARTVLGLVDGECGSFEQCLLYHLREREVKVLSKWTLAELRSLWQLRSQRSQA